MLCKMGKMAEYGNISHQLTVPFYMSSPQMAWGGIMCLYQGKTGALIGLRCVLLKISFLKKMRLLSNIIRQKRIILTILDIACTYGSPKMLSFLSHLLFLLA